MEYGGETKEGFLEKRRDTVSFFWRRYWFQLKEGKLCYFKSRDCTSPHGVIELNKMKTIGELTSTGKNFSFGIMLSVEKTVILAADSAEECKSWIETLLSKSSSARRSSSERTPVSPRQKVFSSERKSVSTIWYTPASTLTEHDGVKSPNRFEEPQGFKTVATQEPRSASTQNVAPKREPPKIPPRPPIPDSSSSGQQRTTADSSKPPLKTPPLPPKTRKCLTPESQAWSSPTSPSIGTLTIEASDKDDDVFEEVIYDVPRPYPDMQQDKDFPVAASSS